MDIVVAGAHGQIARLLIPRLVARGDKIRGIIRNPDHHDDIVEDGAEPVVCDLENAVDAKVDEAVTGADVIVFAAGAGPGSGPARKWTVDHGSARRLIDTAVRLGVPRFVMISAMGTDDPPKDRSVFSIYLQAKARADDDLRASGLDYTIVRPGRLYDDAGYGLVDVRRHVEPGEITRDDVAAVLTEVLGDPRTSGRTVELVAGSTPVAEVGEAIEQITPDDTGAPDDAPDDVPAAPTGAEEAISAMTADDTEVSDDEVPPEAAGEATDPAEEAETDETGEAEEAGEADPAEEAEGAETAEEAETAEGAETAEQAEGAETAETAEGAEEATATEAAVATDRHTDDEPAQKKQSKT